MTTSQSRLGSTKISSTTAPRRELVERICASTLFSKSQRLSSLLTYVCDIALSGRESEITEQKIGTALFGKSPNYDSSIDGIVRTQASRLRQKLEQYFETEGANERVQIIIPKGGYVPFFVPRPSEELNAAPLAPAVMAVTTEALATVDTQEEKQAHPIPSFPFAWVLVGALTLACVALCIYHRGALKYARSGTYAPVNHPLWSQMFAEHQTTLVVPGDSGLVMRQGILNRNIGLSEFLSGDRSRSTSTMGSSVLKEADDFGSRRYTSIVDLEVDHDLAQIALHANSKSELRYARDIRPDDLKHGNVVLIGATEANPWVELYEQNMNYYVSHDRSRRIMSIVNRAPQGNEPNKWDSAYDDPKRRVFGVVAYLPSIRSTENVLIVEGTSMSGTEAAWDFVSNDYLLLPFLKSIHHGSGPLPHFEVVLETNNYTGDAVKARVLAWRASN